MATSLLIHEDVGQLLQEAGCSNEFTQQFLAAMETENLRNQLRLLSGQRSHQLERLHEEERKLDRLDYLRDKLEKQLPPAAKISRRRR